MIVGGIGLGAITAFVRLRYKLFIVSLLTAATVFFMLFTLMLLQVIPKHVTGLAVTLIMGSLLCAGANPLFYELSVEVAYPAGEGMVGACIALVNNVAGA